MAKNITQPHYEVGMKIKFAEEVQRYTIQACDERFIIATKPFNARKTFLYVIVDLKDRLRGADNWYCKYDYQDRQESEEALKELQSGVMEVSYRNRIELKIERIDRK